MIRLIDQTPGTTSIRSIPQAKGVDEVVTLLMGELTPPDIRVGTDADSNGTKVRFWLKSGLGRVHPALTIFCESDA